MITGDDEVLMEIKVSDRYPLWLTQILSEMKLYRRNFSKYGTIYSELFKASVNRTASRNTAAAGYPAYPAVRKENVTCLVQS